MIKQKLRDVANITTISLPFLLVGALGCSKQLQMFNPPAIEAVEKDESKQNLYACFTDLQSYLSTYSSEFAEFNYQPPAVGFAEKLNKRIENFKTKGNVELDPLDEREAIIACQTLKKCFGDYQDLWSKMANSWFGPYDPNDPLDLKEYSIFNEHQVKVGKAYTNIQRHASLLSLSLDYDFSN